MRLIYIYIYINIYIYISRSPTKEYLQYEPVISNKMSSMWKKYMYIAMEVFVKSNFEVKNTSRVCSFVTETEK